jgi:hypothetical protein
MMIVDRALNLGACVLLRTCSLPRAHAALRFVGRFLPRRSARAELAEAGAALAGRGTCLSRALAVAARAPASDLVIGVQREGATKLAAHAWLELDGLPVSLGDPWGQEIYRLRGRR